MYSQNLAAHPQASKAALPGRLQLFRDSRVRSAPSNTRAARALAGHCLATLGPHTGMTFLNAAARDDKLPKKTRQFYAQALAEMDRHTVEH